MTEPTLTCPTCGTVIKLTESLAAPLLAATRDRYEKLLADKERDMATQREQLRRQQQAVAQARESLEREIQQRLERERTRLAAEEAQKARRAAALELQQRQQALEELQELLKQREAKLAEAQKQQAEVLRRERALQDAQRELDLTVEKRVRAGLEQARQEILKQADQEHRLRLLEKDQQLASMQKQIEELRRKAEQGSQQLQGEVQELHLEALLTERFARDRIEPVPKGQHGGDILQRVLTPSGQVCGTILWESKRTKHFSDAWLAKLRHDQRQAKAELAVLVSQALPEGIESFDLRDGVWVVAPRFAVALAVSLRQGLLELALARQAAEGQQTKMELVYQYLTGPRFRQRIHAMVEAFTTMREDLDKEKRAIQRQWAKRETQIERVLEATAGMVGDLQGIAGRSLDQLEGFDWPALEPGPAPADDSATEPAAGEDT